jgi:leucyl/phenylalanyl-tRNA--protein transferase
MERAELTPDLLLKAYTLGVFPMAESREDPDIFWVDPRRRGIMPLTAFHISRSLARRLRRGGFEIAVDRDFANTVRGCADRPETWINATIFDLYCALHDSGFAHSLEVWRDDQLVGGVYGVTLGGVFFGESMFSRETDASKIALAYLVDRLRQAGFSLFDTQFTTPHLRSLGGHDIPRATYHRLLAAALEQSCVFLAPETPDPQSLVQRNTQTS